MWRIGISLITIINLFLYLVAVSRAGIDIDAIMWKNVSRGIRDLDLRAVAVSPDDPDIVYIGSSITVYCYGAYDSG